MITRQGSRLSVFKNLPKSNGESTGDEKSFKLVTSDNILFKTS